MAFDFKKWINEGNGKAAAGYTHHPEYDALPDCIKHVYNPCEYAWLTNDQRSHLIESECCPEPEPDEDY